MNTLLDNGRRGRQILASVFAISALAIGGLALAQDDADADEGRSDGDAADLGKLEVTGSRIRRIDLEGPSPIVVLDREDIEAQGFATVYEALENLPQNTGTLQGEQYTNSFTPNAQSLSLRSLGGGRTLVLLNGRRVADYPQPYNSQSNFFNFATIPTAAIERVEILTGSASAIYGSDAIAGVINVILREDVAAPTLSVRAGTTLEGGGDSLRANAVWGKQWDRLSLTVAAEHHSIEPIYGKDRDYLDSVEDAPQLAGQIPYTRSALILSNWYDAPTPDDWEGPDPYPGVYYDPGQETCDSMQSAGVPYEYAFRAGRGTYCGRDDFGDETLQNERDRNSIYVSMTMDVGESSSIYADLMYWDSSSSLQGFHNWWGGDVWDPNIVSAAGFAGDWTYVQRIFHPNETGSQESTFDESALNTTIGMEGSFANFWNWEAGVTYSTNDYEERQDRFKEEVADAYFGGSEMVDICVPLLGFACDFFQRDYSTAQFSIYDRLSQADIDAVMGRMAIDSDASVWSAFAEVDGDLWEMKHGPVQFAGTLEFASQEYQITPDSRLLDQTGNGWWGLSGTGGGGERDRSAVGVEFLIPLRQDLRATVAGRYDNYDDDSDVGGAGTYGLGLEYRPMDTLLLRASYNTSFRAPDMHYLYADESGFFTGTRDIWQCRQEAIDDGTEYDELACDVIGVAGTRRGSLDLEEEDGESLTVGFTWNPVDSFEFGVDYFELELSNAVRDMSVLQLNRDEADCQLGETVTGEAVDINSAECQSTLARITRDPQIGDDLPDLDTVNIDPINSSLRRQKGFDARMAYTIDTDRAGSFKLSFDYTHVLKDERQLYVEDEIDKDYRDDLTNFNARSIVNGAVSWDFGSFNSVLYAHRLGSMPNWQETGRLPTWTTYNFSATQRLMDDKLVLSVLVNNLTNERPPYDDGFTTWPFFFRGQYNARGRELFGMLTYTFE